LLEENGEQENMKPQACVSINRIWFVGGGMRALLAIAAVTTTGSAVAASASTTSDTSDPSRAEMISASQTHAASVGGDLDKAFARSRVFVTLARGVTVTNGRVALEPTLGDPPAAVQLINAALDRCPRASLLELYRPFNATLAAQIGLDRGFVLHAASPDDLNALVNELSPHTTIVESIELIAAGRAHDDRAVPFQSINGPFSPPNDELYPLQYALENRGQEIWGVEGIPHADIRGALAWTITRGSSDVTIAILDSGVSLSHPDIAHALTEGRNFTSGNTDDVDDAWVSHGTHIAGIIGAEPNNLIGTAGLAPGCKIMPIRVLDRFGFTFEDWVAQGIMYATDHGATVLNISLGFPTASSVMRNAITYAHEHGVVICASSGNISSDPIGFPARLPETIAVGATNNRDENAGFTSPGPEMTIAAPGRDIYSSWDTNSQPDTYVRRSGTSFATPHVVAGVALIQSIRPDLSPEQIRWALTSTAHDIDQPGWDEVSGAGRLNVYRALKAAQQLPMARNPLCQADFNNDHSVDFLDIQAFLEAVSNQDMTADFRADGQIDFFDVVAFMQVFQRGCG